MSYPVAFDRLAPAPGFKAVVEDHRSAAKEVHVSEYPGRMRHRRHSEEHRPLLGIPVIGAEREKRVPHQKSMHHRLGGAGRATGRKNRAKAIGISGKLRNRPVAFRGHESFQRFHIAIVTVEANNLFQAWDRFANPGKLLRAIAVVEQPFNVGVPHHLDVGGERVHRVDGHPRRAGAEGSDQRGDRKRMIARENRDVGHVGDPAT